MAVDWEKVVGYQLLDPTGKVGDGMKMVERYLPFVGRQQDFAFQAWRAKRHEEALIELHFMLVAIDRVRDGLTLADVVIGSDLTEHLASRDYRVYQDARNHFEHIDDRVHLSKRNAPRPTLRDGVMRTVHYGLDAETEHFVFGDQRVDISRRTIVDFEAYVAVAKGIVDGRL